MDYVSYAMIVSKSSRRCGGTGTIDAAHNSLYCYPLLKFGTEEQKQKYLFPAASGQSVGCYALTEGLCGQRPLIDPDYPALGRRPLGDQRREEVHRQWEYC